jgi:hypothetical protein
MNPHDIRIAVQGGDLFHVVEHEYSQALGASRHSTPRSGVRKDQLSNLRGNSFSLPVLVPGRVLPQPPKAEATAALMA